MYHGLLIPRSAPRDPDSQKCAAYKFTLIQATGAWYSDSERRALIVFVLLFDL